MLSLGSRNMFSYTLCTKEAYNFPNLCSMAAAIKAAPVAWQAEVKPPFLK